MPEHFTFADCARRSGRLAPVVLAFALLSGVRTARAEGFDEPERDADGRVKDPPQASAIVAPPARVAEGSWYGWQTLATDGVALSFFAVSMGLIAGDSADRSAANTPLAFSGAVFVLGAPIVHASHENWGAAGASLGLRVALPALGAGIGAGLDDCGHDESDACPLAGVALGGLLGIGAAIAIDSALLSRERPSEPTRASSQPPPSVTAVPFAFAERDRAVLGFSGTF